MEAKEKAKELVEKFKATISNTVAASYNYSYVGNIEEAAMECALIAVDEILAISYFIHEPSEDDELYRNYFLHVKEEIKRLKLKGY